MLPNLVNERCPYPKLILFLILLCLYFVSSLNSIDKPIRLFFCKSYYLKTSLLFNLVFYLLFNLKPQLNLD